MVGAAHRMYARMHAPPPRSQHRQQQIWSAGSQMYGFAALLLRHCNCTFVHESTAIRTATRLLAQSRSLFTFTHSLPRWHQLSMHTGW